MTTMTPPPKPAAAVVELCSGPHTIAGPGETCLVCGDPLSAGEVFLFARWHGGAGVAHEDCAESELAAATEAPSHEHWTLNTHDTAEADAGLPGRDDGIVP